MTLTENEKHAAAARVRATADNWLHDALVHWGPDAPGPDAEHPHRIGPDAAMIRGAEQDAADLNDLADLIFAGRLIQARNRADRLDTIVREAIDAETWDALHAVTE